MTILYCFGSNKVLCFYKYYIFRSQIKYCYKVLFVWQYNILLRLKVFQTILFLGVTRYCFPRLYCFWGCKVLLFTLYYFWGYKVLLSQTILFLGLQGIAFHTILFLGLQGIAFQTILFLGVTRYCFSHYIVCGVTRYCFSVYMIFLRLQSIIFLTLR